jgi:hypothetical protein
VTKKGGAARRTGTAPTDDENVLTGKRTVSAKSTAGERQFQPMPELTPDEYAALRDDIAARGILVSVVVDQHGRLIDGHHRRRVCDELGVDCPTTVRHVADDNEALDIAVAVNAARRHLTREQKRDLIRSEIARRPDDSDRTIARRVGCDHKTVGAVRRELRGEIPHPGDGAGEHVEAGGPGEAALGAMLARVIRDRFADNPDTWRVPHDLADYIEVVWPWPTHPQHVAHRDVAYALFVCCPPESPVWDVMNPWLYGVAHPALREYADLEQLDPDEYPDLDLDFIWPGKSLAELSLVVCNPALPVEVQLMLHKQLDVKIAFAVLDCERFLSRETIAKWQTVAGLPDRRARGGAR